MVGVTVGATAGVVAVAVTAGTAVAVVGVGGAAEVTVRDPVT